MNVLYVTADRTSIDELNMELVKTASNAHVEYVGTLREAGERLTRPERIDAVLIDQRLPDGEGLSLVPQIRKRDADLPIVAVLRTDGRVSPLTALRAGADDYVTKDESFAARLLPTLEDARARGQRGSTGLRIIYAGDVEFALKHLTDALIKVQIAPAPPSGDGRLRIIPDFAAEGTALPFDLVMLECGFPGVQAFELLKEVRTRRGDIPVVLVIKPQEEDLAGPALKLGAADWVVKSEASFGVSVPKLQNLTIRHRLLRDRDELFNNRELLKATVDNAPIGLFRVAADGTILETNAAGLSVFRVDRKERFVHSSIYVHVAPESRELLRGFLRDVCTGLARTAEIALPLGDGGRPMLEIRGVQFDLRSAAQPSALVSAHEAGESHAEPQPTTQQGVEQPPETHDAEARRETLERLEAQVSELSRQHEAERETWSRGLVDTEAHFGRLLDQEREQRHALEQALAEARASLEGINDELAERDRAVHSLKTSEEAINRLTTEHEHERGDLQRRLSAAETRILELGAERHAEVEALNKAVADRTRRLEVAQSAAAESQSRVQALEREYTTATARLDKSFHDAEQKIASLLEQETARNSSFEAARNESEALVRTLTQERKAATDGIAELRRSIHDREEQWARAAQQAADRQAALESAVAAAEERAHSLAGERDRAREQLAQELSTTEQRLTKELREEADRRSALETALADREIRVRALSAERDHMAEQLEQHHHALRDTTQKFEHALQEEAERRTALETANADIQTELRRLANERDAATERLQHVLREHDQHVKRLAKESGDTRAALEAALANAEARVRELASDRDAAVESHHNVLREHEQRLSEIRRESAETQALEARLVHTEPRMSEVTKERDEAIERHQQTLRESEQRLRDAAKEARDRQATLETALAEAETRAQTLTKEREVTAEHLKNTLRESEERLRQIQKESDDRQAVLQTALTESEAKARTLVNDRDQATEQLLRSFHESERRLTDRVTDESSRRATLESALAEAEARATALTVERDRAIEQMSFAAREKTEELASRLNDEVARQQTLEAELNEARSRARSLVVEHDATVQHLRQVFREGEERLTHLLSEEAAKRASLEVTLAEARMAQEAASRSLVEGPFGMLRCSADGQILEANRALVEMLGWNTRSELARASVEKDLLAEADEYTLLVEACRLGSLSSWEMTWKQKDGTPITVRLGGGFDHQSETLTLTVEDITDAHIMEKQLRQARRMESVGRLASEASQTFQNLFGTVADHLERLSSVLDREDQQTECELARQATTRARSSAQQLFTFSQRQLSALEALDLNHWLGEMEPVLRRIAGDQIEVTVAMGSPLGWVDVEADDLERILLSLTMSSREVMPLGGKLGVETANLYVDRRMATRHAGLRSGPHVLLSVLVHGCGVETVGHLEALDRSGFGLETVRGLVRQSGGHFWLEHPVTGEIRFNVCLPQSQIDRRRRGRQTLSWTEPSVSP